MNEGNSHTQPKHRNIINLSTYKLDPEEVSLLEKGLSFVPTPKLSCSDLVAAAETFGLRLKRQTFFDKSYKSDKIFTSETKFIGKSNWCPPDSRLDPEVLACIDGFVQDVSQLEVLPERQNLSKSEFESLQKIRKNPDLVFKKADKGSATVIMSRELYIQEGYRQLNNGLHYKKLDQLIFLETSDQISQILLQLKTEGLLTKKQFEYLKPPSNPRPRRFYMLPKIHKPVESWTVPNKMPKGRPIVSDCSSESEKVASFIDDYIKYKAQTHPAFIKDTYDFVQKIRQLDIPDGALLITMDVESMYTNIDHEKGLQAVREAFVDSKDPKLDAILKLLELSLKRNDFEFNNVFYLQTLGTSMGKKWAPHYADIFMAKFEKEALSKCPNPPHTYYRYLDDVFIVWTHGREAFSEFLNIFNSHQPPISFKAEIENSSINFLDTTVFKNNNHGRPLLTKVYFKPTDTHQLLYKTSFHPKHTFRGVIKSQLFRFHKICSHKSDFEEAWLTLHESLSKRNYSKRWLRKVKLTVLHEIEQKEIVEGVVLQAPSCSHWGAGPCGNKRCMTCKTIPNCQNFTSYQLDDTHSFNGRLSCDSSHIIYLYSCRLCGQEYVGETGNTLRERNNRHRDCIKRHDREDALADHLLEKHSTEIKHWDDRHFILVPIEKVVDLGQRHLNKTLRLEREEFWIKILQTFVPYGMNTRRYNYRTKPPPLENRMMPIVIPFSRTATKVVQIIKKHIKILQEKDTLCRDDFKIIAAYSRHKNLSDSLVSSKLKSLDPNP